MNSYKLITLSLILQPAKLTQDSFVCHFAYTIRDPHYFICPILPLIVKWVINLVESVAVSGLSVVDFKNVNRFR